MTSVSDLTICMSLGSCQQTLRKTDDKPIFGIHAAARCGSGVQAEKTYIH